MKIKIKQIEHTGIDPEHYSVGDIVECHKDLINDMVFIKMPGDTTHYILTPNWFQVVEV
jgi:hypothetical protein